MTEQWRLPSSLLSPPTSAHVFSYWAFPDPDFTPCSACRLMRRGRPTTHLMEMFVPFKAVIDLGGARGVMMAYHELDEIPAAASPVLYDALADRGYDDLSLRTITRLITSSTPSPIRDRMRMLSNSGSTSAAGPILRLTLDIFLNLSSQRTAPSPNSRSKRPHTASSAPSTISASFDDPYNPDSVDSAAHVPATLDAAHRSIVLLENRDSAFPITAPQGIKTIALIGPFGDILNYGDYSGPWRVPHRELFDDLAGDDCIPRLGRLACLQLRGEHLTVQRAVKIMQK
ncbi:hypothetical protein DFH07DRAFT_975043 [Mycena maculata]|uniref:Uncharacterized protein n=1 Tax=Mycena maculata TaxID=230809 RepID=A0AAD7H4D0_9AGAR|nr:hypothetical protein DFH07DRAFT_975043 [Mycena maculata]